MAKECLEILKPEAGYIYIDGTLGMGGHSRLILENINNNINNNYNNINNTCLVGIDRDEQSLKLAENNLNANNLGNLKKYFVHSRFSKIPEIIENLNLNKKLIKGILLDLGISSYQLGESSYGLSFGEKYQDQELDMRLDPWCEISAGDIINTWTEKKLADLFWDIADYKKARKLARKIIETREHKKISTVGDLVRICEQVEYSSFNNIKKNTKNTKNNNRKRINPATLPLMALRIQVNSELDELKTGLSKIIDFMEPECNLVVLSFHSGEDRIVKNIFRDYKEKDKNFFEIYKKPMLPSLEEIRLNPRSRSVKLRKICKTTI